jgi:hypothetical protein
MYQDVVEGWIVMKLRGGDKKEWRLAIEQFVTQ